MLTKKKQEKNTNKNNYKHVPSGMMALCARKSSFERKKSLSRCAVMFGLLYRLVWIPGQYQHAAWEKPKRTQYASKAFLYYQKNVKQYMTNTIHLTLKMTSAQVVETSVTNNSFFRTTFTRTITQYEVYPIMITKKRLNPNHLKIQGFAVIAPYLFNECILSALHWAPFQT